MLNGDVLTDIDLTAQIAQHERTGATATLALVPVDGPERLRPGALDDDSSVSEFVEKPQLRPDRHEPDQRRRLCARARDPRADPARTQRLDRARGVAAADRQRALRLPLRELLARHRHARALPAGHLRHPRGQRQAPPCRSASATATWRSTTSAEVQGRVIPPGVIERGRARRRGRPRRQPRGARRGRLDRRRAAPIERAVILNGSADRRGLHAARLHRRPPGCRIGASTTDHRRRRARRGRHHRGRQRDCPRRAHLPRCAVPDGAIKF